MATQTRLFAVLCNNYLDVQTHSLNKFKQDEIDTDTQDYRIVLHGVIFNKRDLCGKGSLTDYVVDSLHEGTVDFFSNFRGNFAGIIYDKKQKTLFAFTDQFCMEPLFYYRGGATVVVSTDVLEIARYVKKHELHLSANKVGAYSLITYGYMLEDNTLFDGIKRIVPGEYVKFYNDRIDRIVYWTIKNEKIQIDENQAIEEIDRLFLKAVEQQAAKNQEYGFDNYAALSAGLDSRIVCYALKRLGINNVVTFTYSQSGELDDVLPRKMASDLGYIWLFKNLDHGLDMIEIEEALNIGQGIQYYLWPAQLNGFLQLIDREKLGVVHTGVIGDVVVGTFYRQLTPRNYQIGDGAYSKTMLKKLMQYYQPKDEDYEIGMLYNRALNGASTGYSTSFLKCCEPFSPFMDVDFFEFCLSLPTELRIGHRLYYKWVLQKYPEATRYSHNGLKIKTSKHYINYHDRPIPLNGIFDRVISNAKSKAGISKGMNPVTEWYKGNKQLKSRMDTFFSACSGFIADEELRINTETLYNTGTVMEKAMCISLAGTLKAVECGE